jgi:hypothetical protein
MARDKKQQGIFERSGKFTSRNPLVSFLYELMRDHVPPGVVEGILDDRGAIETTFTNGWLARYAQDVARRLDPQSGYSDGCCPKCGARPGEPCDPGLHG